MRRWLCFPNFKSSRVFGAGEFFLRPSDLLEYRTNPREKKTIARSQPVLGRSVENRAGDGHVCALGQPQRETVLSMRSARPRCSHDAPPGHQDTQTVAPHCTGGEISPINSNQAGTRDAHRYRITPTAHRRPSQPWPPPRNPPPPRRPPRSPCTSRNHAIDATV